MLRVDGILVSQASVKRAMARRGLLMPIRYQAERRALAKARKAVFLSAPDRRNRIWQMDFSDFETTTGGNWQICSVVDYVSKYTLACTASGTQTGRDAVETLAAAIVEAEAQSRRPLAEDCRDPQTGEVHPLVIVSDNGPAFKSDLFLRFIASHPELNHVRTRYRAPHTNGVVERWTGSLKYDQLYREEIPTGWVLGQQCEAYRRTYNQVRPHESLAFATPESAYLLAPTSPPRPVPGRFAGIGLVGALGPEVDNPPVSGPNLFPAETV